ncbi:Uncharacterised protein [Moraxella lacunata]|uniref:Uncharacterized protein n=1 Tax=Moraxella lacunata TaxID=477 RepID=A0A378UEN8_MORLA|nr:hypothetical protein [Moraxella lacunata]STZ74842.1 Uncharacterised protein [Moraxella lacunata]
MRYKRLCLYRENSSNPYKKNYASISDNMNVLTEDLTELILNYLESGCELMTFVTPMSDPYNNNDKYPYTIYTDNVYIWDSVIINWIRKYRIRLPDDFIHHVERQITKVDTEFTPYIDDALENAEEIWL